MKCLIADFCGLGTFHSLATCIVALLLAGIGMQTSATSFAAQEQTGPVRVVAVRLTHAHVHWLLGRDRERGDIELVGVFEPNTELAQRLLKQHGLSESLLFDDLDTMLKATKPEAACLFGSIFEHRDHTLACANRGVHVLVEKPLAVSVQHAQQMATAARKAGIHLLTNYETTWYASNHAVKKLAASGELGDVRRIVVRCGHRGPIEIGCNAEFLEWLTDPKLNGGGALTDFGCYGANLATWLMDGQRPLSVFAITKQIKPDKYPHVDDDATVLLEYPNAVASIEGSWNWPISLKEMDVYFRSGEANTIGSDALQLRRSSEGTASTSKLTHRPTPQDDPFAYLAAVVRKQIEPSGLSSLANNLIVMEILDAAKQSAESGKSVRLGATGDE